MRPPSDEYKTMRAIGKPRGLTSHVIGRILLAAGLRTRDGQPTFYAKEQGLAAPYELGYGRVAWKWHEEFVSTLLDEWLDTQSDRAAPNTRRGG